MSIGAAALKLRGTVPRHDWLLCAIVCVQLDWAGAALAALMVDRREVTRAVQQIWLGGRSLDATGL